MFKEFLYGLSYPFKTIKLFFQHPKISLLSIVPLIINAVIYGTIFFIAFSYLYDTILDISKSMTVGLGFLEYAINYLVFILTFFVVLLLCYILFVIAGGILSSPFNEAISQRVEIISTGELVSSTKGFFADLLISLRAELIKLSFLVLVTIPLFLLGFIPVIGILFFSLATIFSMFFNTLDFVDYPLTRRHVKFKEKVKLILSNKSVTFGFGATAFVITFIPGVNIILRPILVVAGTSLYFDKFQNQKS